MTEQQLELLLSGDLAALGDDNRREPLAMPHSTGVYRDARSGTEARRDALVEDRRGELALMPLALSQVFAHRVARGAAGAAGVACAVAILLALSDPVLAGLAATIVPGLDAFSCVALIAAVVLGCHVGATAIAQRWFERRMYRAIGASLDAHADLDRLAEGPLEVARQLVRRVDGWAVALGLAGTAALMAVLGFCGFVATAADAHPLVWRRAVRRAGGLLAHDAQLLLVALALAVAWAAVVGVACDREHRRGTLPRWIRWLAHGAVPALAVALGFAALYTGMRAARVARVAHVVPTSDVRVVLVMAAVTAVVLVATWAALWWRRREHARLGDREKDRT